MSTFQKLKKINRIKTGCIGLKYKYMIHDGIFSDLIFFHFLKHFAFITLIIYLTMISICTKNDWCKNVEW